MKDWNMLMTIKLILMFLMIFMILLTGDHHFGFQYDF